MKEILSRLDDIKTILSSPLTFWASLASISSIILTLINTILLVSIIRKIKSKKALTFLIRKLNELKNILNKDEDDIPSDVIKRVHSVLEDIKKFRIMVFSFKLKSLIKEIKSHNELTTDNKGIIQNKIDLILNELKDLP